MIFEDVELEIKKLYKYCLKLSGSPWVAEDLVQETMLKVYKLKNAEPERQFNFSFLCTVAKNLFIDDKRKMKETIHFIEDFYGEACDSLEYDSLLEVLFTSLPLKQAMLITLKDVFGYTTKEIAAMLRVSNESIKTALHRSRKKLTSATEIDREVALPNHQIIVGLSRAIKESKPMHVFYYYRLLETRNFKMKRSPEQSVIHVIDPDGNILELLSR
ncbi:RNA polymerase sigma factor [Sporosarcina sp. ACRSL]|uniref:RNA polymerase sigma factor n=1 Tax=Sporosarcina sp. ACRSL TaxID=2918215 RepID=UPI001EF60104|nr:RNA polymerase sigma factor [Sporosarcina sp. ACRSL]MCG7344876.1 RNA polymerase sigma factor [Sporosarcina sp. ACRSL]